jgi:hypothetical protein
MFFQKVESFEKQKFFYSFVLQASLFCSNLTSSQGLAYDGVLTKDNGVLNHVLTHSTVPPAKRWNAPKEATIEPASGIWRRCIKK